MTPPFPSKRYTIIYADPPWMYGSQLWNRGGTDGHYNTQDCDWIARLPVGDLAEWNSVCFMWATMPRLPEALYVMRAWGFEYKTVAFTWGFIYITCTLIYKPFLIAHNILDLRGETCRMGL